MSKNSELQHYSSIEWLPVWNYSKCIESDDLRYLLRLADYSELPKIDGKILSNLIKAWELINAEIVDFIGISENAKQICRLQRTIAMLHADRIVSQSRQFDTLIELKERELTALLPSKSKQSIEESVIHIEAFMKIPVDVFTLTVKKYYLYINHIQKNGR